MIKSLYILLIASLLIANIYCIQDTNNDEEVDIKLWKISNYFFPDKTIQFEINFATPTKAGTYPVYFFESGLKSLVPGFAFEDLMVNMARQGVVMVMLSKLNNIMHDIVKDVNTFTFCYEWALQNLQAEFNKVNLTDVIPDLENQGVFGCHSSSCHVIVQYLNNTCGKAKGLAMISPVDGADPYGKIQEFITHPPQLLPFQIPNMIIMGGLDNEKLNFLEPLCAPATLADHRFYEVMAGPSWLLNFTDYGHVDCMSGILGELSDLACKSCYNNCNLQQYRRDLAHLVNSFIRATLYKESENWDALEKFTGVQSRVVGEFKYNGFNKEEMGGFCRNDNQLVKSKFLTK